MGEYEKHQAFVIAYRALNQQLYELMVRGQSQGLEIVDMLEKQLASTPEPVKREDLIKARDDLAASLEKSVKAMDRLTDDLLSIE